MGKLFEDIAVSPFDGEIVVYLTMVAPARERPINLLPGRRWPAKGGSEEEFGQKS